MQRIMQTPLEWRGLAAWVDDRVLRLLKDGATVHMAKGYRDYVYRRGPDYISLAGEPFAAEHYHEGLEKDVVHEALTLSPLQAHLSATIAQHGVEA